MKHIAENLLDWFKNCSRPLPWRKSYNPYHVWISEIMLQQTQMERGVGYFTRWIARFPDVAAVARAEEQEIMKLWEGLGYYARARNLHATAKIVHAEFGGDIPCDTETLLTLPGIGPYTAAAISSIAGNVDIPVVDANVLRVFARLFDIEGNIKSGAVKKDIEQKAWELLPKGKARLYNQALMDLGGLICLPRNPRCNICPVAELCRARRQGTVNERPVKVAVEKKILIEMATGVLNKDGRLFIQQRLADDIWGGLWEFPGGGVEPGESPDEAVVREYREETGFKVTVCSKITTLTHFYTKYKVVLHCYGCRMISDTLQPLQLTAAQQYRWVFPEELSDFGFPAGHRKLLEYLNGSCPEILVDPCSEIVKN
ncbi:A/G-specific adenine glycosylase [Desulfosediminicola sp.]|uniref:A/G-specific adenine glycosylase n=1 Tax=Desulfosediminicola sp. TaxID=2886825 RepID=UPI003AF2B454